MLKRGDICRTNLSQPGGLVMVLDIWDKTTEPTARIVHVDNHPYGYERGTTGDYLVKDLILVEASVIENCKGCGTQMDMCSYCHNTALAHNALYDEIEYGYHRINQQWEDDALYNDFDEYDPPDHDDYEPQPCPYCEELYCDKPACKWEGRLDWEHSAQWKNIEWVKDGGDPLTYDARAEIEAEMEIPF
jgi:hypothetical protein